MSCAEMLRTQAWLDGELTGAEAEAVVRHLQTCEACQAFQSGAAQLGEAMRRSLPREAAPASLRLRLGALLDAETASPRLPPHRPARARPGFWTGTAAGAGLSALVAGLAALALLPPSAASLADEVTAAHTRALMTGREIEVVSTDHHTVKPWFAGRLALSPPVADFTAEGFKLTGGRTDTVAGAPAAVVTYQHGRHEIDLFVWADRGAPPPAAGVSHGYHVLFWKRRDLDFAAVSDTAAPELAQFAALVRAEPE